MNTGLKQRLVGALVLICGALILWPIVFNEGGGPGMDRRSQIPPMPEFEKYEVPEPVRPENIVPVKAPAVEKEPPRDEAPVVKPAAPDTADDKSATGNRRTPMPKLDQQGLPQGWVLQVASFSDARNAEQLKLDLQKQGYKAFTRRVDTSAGAVVRVYIGPKMSKQAFADIRVAIDRQYKVKSIVVKFEQ